MNKHYCDICRALTEHVTIYLCSGEHMIEFPSEVPLEAVQLLYAAWKNKDVTTPGLPKAIWNLAGYVAGIVFPNVRRANAAPPTEEQIDKAFQNLLSGALDFDSIRIVGDVGEELKQAA